MFRAKFFILDVFAESRFQGNQLAVFTDLKNISELEMQQIAREINFSETTFVLSNTETEKGYPVRIFTPMQEVKFAGHPTLGTAWLIQKEIIKKAVDKVALDLKAGSIPVSFKENGLLWMEQLQPQFGEIFKTDLLAEIMQINPSEIDKRFPIEEVSTGLPAIIVPLKKLETIKKIKINKEKYFELVSKIEPKLILAFCPETYKNENQLNVRVFVDYFGIPEDPATGSGNGCLAGYLVKNKYFNPESIDIRVEQGYEVGRPSRLYLKASKSSEKYSIKVGGKVQLIASGNWE
jgi:trans-2,3-dihydro-3-hydroxyanthranilate isomerase